jgi:phosphatidylserine decarboxylase
MTDAIETQPLAYPSFNAFFTRALRPDARPLAGDESVVACPIDGTVSQIGALDEERILQAKGRSYSLDALLARPGCWSRTFTGGAFATLYLAPYNYHRIHAPLTGILREAWYVPGRLFSVNAATAAGVDNLFARNERVICILEHEHFFYAVILVGALFVGSMATVWHGDITPRSRHAVAPLKPSNAERPPAISRGAELGRFNMGSTVILLFPPQRITWTPGLEVGSQVQVGQSLARVIGEAAP